MKNHPLTTIFLNGKGRLVTTASHDESLVCPTCMQSVRKAADNSLMTHLTHDSNVCSPKSGVVVTKAILQCLNEGKRIYVRPVIHGSRKIAPGVIVAPESQSVSPFINEDYQPAGGVWRSQKGLRLGVFYLSDRATHLKKDGFDYIAVINPERFIEQFDQLWAAAEVQDPLAVMITLLLSPNSASEWVKWPNSETKSLTRISTTPNWYDYESSISSVPTCSAVVTGIEDSQLGETIYILQVSIEKDLGEFQLVRSMGSTLLLNNTGDAISPAYSLYGAIRAACIEAVRLYARYNKFAPSVVISG